MFSGRNWSQGFLKYLQITIALIVGLSSYPNLVLAQSGTCSRPQSKTHPPIRYKPNSRGTPPARNATGSRGNCPQKNIPLLGLGGQAGYTQTVSEYPTIWVYIPYTADEVSQGEFELQEENGKTIEKISISLSTTPSIISIRLSQPLSVNQKYRWYLAINCRLDSSSVQTVSGEDVITGLVQRILLSDELNRQLKMAQTPLERISIYAENSIWYDTLTELIQLYLAQPIFETTWVNFLKDVGLENLSQASLQ